jgi:hypothetical protein
MRRAATDEGWLAPVGLPAPEKTARAEPGPQRSLAQSPWTACLVKDCCEQRTAWRFGHFVFRLSRWRYGRKSEVDRLAAAAAVDLGELVVGAGEADPEPLDLAGPAFLLGFGDAGGEVSRISEMRGRWAGPGQGMGQACSWMQGVANTRPQFPTVAATTSSKSISPWLRSRAS